MSRNLYIPSPAKLVEIKDEVVGQRAIKSFSTQFLNGEEFNFDCGQCAMLSVFGKGESMISISSPPSVRDHLRFSILRTGRVTSALHEMEVGDVIGIRGPYGNSFPVKDWQGKNIYFIGGGIGLAPLWGALQTVLGNRDDYGDVKLLYGARTSKDLVFKDELEALKSQISVHLSVDVEEPGWDEYVGFVPQNVVEKISSNEDAIAVTCGPPIMIKFVILNLQKEFGFADDQIFTTVENKMKCGIGKCGRCNIGDHYICQDGPVYSWAELKQLPQEY